MKGLLKCLGWLIVIGIGVGLYATFIEPKLLHVVSHEIVSEKVKGETIKVVQFSDTHIGEFFSTEDLKKVVKKINEQSADLVLFTGDLMDNAAEYEGSLEEVQRILSTIEATDGKYAVFGNRDYGGGAEKFYEELMEAAGFKVLLNEHEVLTIKGTALNLYGADDALIGYYNLNQTVQGMEETNLNLLMLHEPDLVNDFIGYPIDLALAGHSHGGQVYLPFVGPLMTTALGQQYVRGFYEVGNQISLYVNTGIGNTKVPFRLFNVPQVTVFELKARE